VCLDTPAKINLYLEVLGKRPDGYHDINSLFQAVSLFDRLTFDLTDRPGIDLTVLGTEHLAEGPENLIVRTGAMMQREFGLRRGLTVTLEKNIPMAAGLAGGSSDAAATILACNLLYDLRLDCPAMARLGLEIGSDLPFFFSGGQALVTGRGERVEETDYPIDYHLVLVNPGLAISTAASYAGLRIGLTKSKHPFNLPCCRTAEDFIESLKQVGNDFEGMHRESYPVLGEIEDVLLERGAALARMSGSGPTIFGIFTDFPEIEVEIFKRWGHWRFFTVAPIALHLQATI
jgi:4-diphosphocytidyl-2-C-methyl-D-erythritol kinase